MKEFLLSAVALIGLFLCWIYCRNNEGTLNCNQRLLMVIGYIVMCFLCIMLNCGKHIDVKYITLLVIFCCLGILFIMYIDKVVWKTFLIFGVITSNLLLLIYILLNSLSVSIYGIVYICCGLIFGCLMK